jgi:hypothetical protein
MTTFMEMYEKEKNLKIYQNFILNFTSTSAQKFKKIIYFLLAF